MRPQIIFHGSEPILRREIVFAVIKNSAAASGSASRRMLPCWTRTALAFIRDHEVSLGISLDAHLAEMNDQTRGPGETRAFLVR